MRRLLLLLICLAGFTLVPRMAFALTCTFAPSGEMVFSGSPSGSAVLDASLNITYSCWSTPLDPGTTVLVCPAVGRLDAATGTRSMKAGSSDLKFQLYSDAARSKVAPDQGYPATLMQLAVVFMGVGNGTFTFPYGRIEKQRVESGDYSANIPITFYYRWLTLLEPPPGCPLGVGTQTTQMNFMARIKVDKTCTVDTSPINFGKMAALPQGQDIDATGSLKINCTPNVGYNILLGNGKAAIGPNARKMFAGSDPVGQSIGYGLYSDPGRTASWGDMITASGQAEKLGTGTEQNYTVYARVPRGQATPPAGIYSDYVIVTVTY